MVSFFRSRDDTNLEEMSGSRKLEKKLGLHRKQTPDVNVDAIKKVGDILNQSQGTTCT